MGRGFRKCIFGKALVTYHQNLPSVYATYIPLHLTAWPCPNNRRTEKRKSNNYHQQSPNHRVDVEHCLASLAGFNFECVLAAFQSLFFFSFSSFFLISFIYSTPTLSSFINANVVSVAPLCSSLICCRLPEGRATCDKCTRWQRANQ